MFVTITFIVLGVGLLALSVWLNNRQKNDDSVEYVFRDPADEHRPPGCRDDDETRQHEAYQRIKAVRDDDTESD